VRTLWVIDTTDNDLSTVSHFYLAFELTSLCFRVENPSVVELSLEWLSSSIQESPHFLRKGHNFHYGLRYRGAFCGVLSLTSLVWSFGDSVSLMLRDMSNSWAIFCLPNATAPLVTMIHSLPSRWHSATCRQTLCMLMYVLVIPVNKAFVDKIWNRTFRLMYWHWWLWTVHKVPWHWLLS
jgi:hypothetical protein